MSDIQETKAETNSDKPLYDEDRNTPLHLASASGNLEEVNDCVAKSKKIDPENFLGWTPLMMAARNGHSEVVKVLINAKANATKNNRYGCSVFMMACAGGNVEIIEHILRHLLVGGVSRQIIESTLSPISMAILFKHDHIVQLLIAKRFNVNAEAAFTAVTPLMYAAGMKNTNIFNILISHGANLFAKNINKQSAQDITASQFKFKKPNLHLQIPQQPQPDQYFPQHFQHAPQPQMVSYLPVGIPYDVTSPLTFLSPQPMFVPVAPTSTGFRMARSSNVSTPYFISPGLTPITYTNQRFFPPEFNPHHLMAQANGYCYAMDNQVMEQTMAYPHITHPHCHPINVTYTESHN